MSWDRYSNSANFPLGEPSRQELYLNRLGQKLPQHAFVPTVQLQRWSDSPYSKTTYTERCGVCGKEKKYYQNGWPVHKGVPDLVKIAFERAVNNIMGDYGLAVIEDEEDENGEYWERQPKQLSKSMPMNQLSNLLREARHIHNVLDQDEVWVGRDSLKVELTRMSARYASNVMAYIKRNARYYRNGWATWEFITKYSGQNDVDEIEEFLDQNNTDTAAKKWIIDTKLYKALAEIAKHSV